jgi:hypothetical protein
LGLVIDKEKKMETSKMTIPGLILIFSMVLTACNLPLDKTSPPDQQLPAAAPTAAQVSPAAVSEQPSPTPSNSPTKEPEIVHKDQPGSPVGNKNQFQTVYDQVDENTAPKKQAFGGEDFRNGKYERPFDQSMNYLPLTDLVTIQLNREDSKWIYVLFKVDKPFSVSPDADTHFLVEIDTNLDNRGDYLIVSGTPKDTKWSTQSVMVFTNPDINIGGEIPVKPDSSLSEGRGYYEEIFNDGKGKDADLAWSRFSKVDQSVVEIAFKNTLTGGEKGKFIWLPWADSGMLDWSLFEFNDHFTLEQAGYPLKEDAKNYPVKALWGVDNTCRLPSGFTPTGTMPGLCPNFDPVQSRPDQPCVPCSGPNCYTKC